MNLYSNWGNVNGFWDGLGYFGSGAVGGAVGVVNPTLGMAITSGGNLATDLANGTLSNLNGVGDWAMHLGFTALEGLGAGAAGKLAKAGFNQLQKWGWVEFNQIVNVSAKEMAAEGIETTFSSTVEAVALKVTKDEVVKSAVTVSANT
ncbi:MAG: hypothetical protein H6572_12125, partial [Lewinellaceae bacterium]|nr:hypothetical protein [Lewinellaceae bacterium]